MTPTFIFLILSLSSMNQMVFFHGCESGARCRPPVNFPRRSRECWRPPREGCQQRRLRGTPQHCKVRRDGGRDSDLAVSVLPRVEHHGHLAHPVALALSAQQDLNRRDKAIAL